MQGREKPADYGVFREHAIVQDELFVLVAMMDEPFVQPIHSFMKFAALVRRPDQHDREYLAVIGDRMGGADPHTHMWR